MIRKLLLVALRWTAFQIGYGLEMGRAEASGRIRPATLGGLTR